MKLKRTFINNKGVSKNGIFAQHFLKIVKSVIFHGRLSGYVLFLFQLQFMLQLKV